MTTPQQMIVDSKPYPTTWQIHLDGLLILLQQARTSNDKSIEETSTLIMALNILYCESSKVKPAGYQEISSFRKAQIMLDVVKLRLRALTKDMDLLFTNSKRPRKTRRSKASVLHKTDLSRCRIGTFDVAQGE